MSDKKLPEIAGAKKNSIYEYRTKNWLKLNELAEEFNKQCRKRGIKSNISKVHVYYWENGMRIPRDRNIIKAIAEVIGIKPTKLMEEFR